MHEYDFFVVEIDALSAKMQNIFKNMVIKAADKYFNSDTYDDIVNDDIHSEEALRGLVRSKVVFLEDDPFADYFDYLKRVEEAEAEAARSKSEDDKEYEEAMKEWKKFTDEEVPEE